MGNDSPELRRSSSELINRLRSEVNVSGTAHRNSRNKPTHEQRSSDQSARLTWRERALPVQRLFRPLLQPSKHVNCKCKLTGAKGLEQVRRDVSDQLSAPLQFVLRLRRKRSILKQHPLRLELLLQSSNGGQRLLEDSGEAPEYVSGRRGREP